MGIKSSRFEKLVYLCGLQGLFLIMLCFTAVSDLCAEVRMGVQSQVEANDNIRLEESNEESDVMYRVSPWITVERAWPRFHTDLSYQPRYTWYEKNPQYDQAGHVVDLGLGGNLSRACQLDWSNRYYKGEEGGSERPDIQGDARLPYAEISSVLASTWETGRDETVGVTVSGRALDYDSQSTSQDSREAEGRLDGRQKFGERGFMTWDTGYLEGRYEDSTAYSLWDGTFGTEVSLTPNKRAFGRVRLSRYTGDDRRDYSSLNPYIGLAGELRKGSYDLGGGVVIRDEEGADPTYRLSLVGTVDVTETWRRGGLTASFACGHEESYIDSDTPGFTTYISGSVSGWYSLSSRWRGSGRCELRDDAYLENREGESDRNDVTLTVTGGIEYQLLKRATLRLDYTYNGRRSDIDTYEYDENSVVLTLNCFTG